MPQSDYLDELILKAVFNGGSLPAIPVVYVALFTSSPGKAGGGTEVSGSGYARVGLTASGALWGVNGPPWTARNVPKIDFGAAAGGPWGLVSSVGLFDAPSGGNLLYFRTVQTAKAVADGDPVVINIDNLQVMGTS